MIITTASQGWATALPQSSKHEKQQQIILLRQLTYLKPPATFCLDGGLPALHLAAICMAAFDEPKATLRPLGWLARTQQH